MDRDLSWTIWYRTPPLKYSTGPMCDEFSAELQLKNIYIFG